MLLLTGFSGNFLIVFDSYVIDMFYHRLNTSPIVAIFLFVLIFLSDFGQIWSDFGQNCKKYQNEQKNRNNGRIFTIFSNFVTFPTIHKVFLQV